MFQSTRTVRIFELELFAELENVVGLNLLRVFREAEAVGYLQFFYNYNYSNIRYFFCDKCYVLQLDSADGYLPVKSFPCKKWKIEKK